MKTGTVLIYVVALAIAIAVAVIIFQARKATEVLTESEKQKLAFKAAQDKANAEQKAVLDKVNADAYGLTVDEYIKYKQAQANVISQWNASTAFTATQKNQAIAAVNNANPKVIIGLASSEGHKGFPIFNSVQNELLWYSNYKVEPIHNYDTIYAHYKAACTDNMEVICKAKAATATAVFTESWKNN